MAHCRPKALARLLGSLLALLLLAAQATSRPAPHPASSQQPSSSSSSYSRRPSAGRRLVQAGGQRPLQPPALAAQPPATPEADTSRRQLRQAEEAVERCRDGLQPEEEQEQCVACDGLQRSKTAACRVWIDRIALHFPRGSTEPPTSDQRDAALAALCGSSPSTGCCTAMAAALEGRCGCNPLFQHVRNETAIEEPILSVEYLKGSNSILALACGFTDAAQLACV